MGGDEASRVLADYVARPDADQLTTAFEALKRIDPARARRAAKDLLAGPRGEDLRPLIGPYAAD